MLKLKYAYKNILISMVASYLLVRRISELFDQITMKLPDEEQFGIIGTIFVGSRKEIVNFYKKSPSIPNFGLDKNTILSIKEGNFRIWFDTGLENFSYLITLVIDDLCARSDDYIKGLIAYKISEWSCFWKTAREVHHEPGESEEAVTILNQKLPLIGSEEYMRNVEKEAERLGFDKELLAYDTQS